VAAAAEISLWSISIRVDNPGWKRAIERLGVNVGMNATAVFIAGLLFEAALGRLGSDTIWGQTIPWLLGALVSDQVNLWLLVGIIYLAHGVKPLEVWRENRWAAPINILVMSVGGGLLALAVRQFGLLGVAIFFLPIVLSAYSFRLTVNNAKEQMARLEEMVTLRTQALANANKKLEALHKEKDAFLAVLTHDMRTPLTSIKGYASILRDRELAREQQVQITKVILHSQDTLLGIVNNILEIEKLQSGIPVLLEYSNFDLALIVKAAAESIEAQASEKKISLHYEAVPSPVIISADVKKIERVLLNLISNAVKYTPEGGKVSIDTRVNGRHAVVEVKDNGYGIPAEELPYIFERFSRVKKHQSMAVGTGLGLAIVKSLVEAHNGAISVVSGEGVGSTFTVKLPI
jgi:signal transduction histidine kinase